LITKRDHAFPFTSRPATEEEIAAAGKANGVESLDDEPPPGTKEFHGYGELLSELEKSKREKRSSGS
jgi:hypothetical protein